MTRDKRIVPALMFHSVGLEKHPWAWSYISESLATFEAKIAALKQNGFTGIFWGELYEYMAGQRTLPENSILLTFDDGYLDNWVHVYPILKKYAMKGTVFASPDFVDRDDQIRPNLDDVMAGRCDPNDLKIAGFLNWAEMREMEKSGLVDIQSHAMTHTWYFTGPKIIGFHEPYTVTPHPWLFWNARPDRKSYYLNEDQQEFLPWGYPIFENQKSLSAQRFFPDEDVIGKITSFVAAQGGREFFMQHDWRQSLENCVSEVTDRGQVPGLYESEEAQTSRITDELQRSKSLIESNLSKEVDFICWPGGANDEAVQEIAQNVGYKSWTLDSRSELDKRNLSGTDPTTIKRIGTSNDINVRGRHCGSGGAKFFMWKIFDHQGSSFYTAAVRAYKLAALVASRGGTR